MKDFITRHKKPLMIAASALIWLAVWQLLAYLIGEQLFLAAPRTVFAKLLELASQPEFYAAVGSTLLRICGGFAAALLVGTLLALAASKSEFVRTLLYVPMTLIKSTPVASFIILALILVGSQNLALLIGFLMSAPLFYSNVLAGIKSVDPARFEAADVFGMSPDDRFRFIYLPYVAPHFISACSVGLGLCWKAGIAAEVIGLTVGSVGEKLYESKIYLDTAQLFAYTFVIVLLSILFERLLMALLRAVERKLLEDPYQHK